MWCIFGFVIVLMLSVASGCSEYEFPCEDGSCIDADLWCDTHKDCSDGSDENYCKKAGYLNSNPNKCSAIYFKCANGPCIPISGRCDGYKNCEDSSDEKNCGDSISRSSSTSQSPKLASSPLEEQTVASSKTNASYYQSRESSSVDAVHHSVQIVYSDLQPSDYSRQREQARKWLLSQRKDDFGWGDETARALTALYLSDVQRSIGRNESNMLMVKQLEVQLSLAVARNVTKSMKLTEIALYINALVASCKDPKNFYGENLVQTLRNGVNAAQRSATFVNPSVYLTLCINNATTADDIRKLYEIHTSRNVQISRMDIQAIALLTTTCIYRNTNLLTATTYDGLRKQFFLRMNSSGFPGNVYEASLIAQALQEMKTSRPGVLDFILKQQQEDGSFGGILATYLVLPVLSGRSFLQMSAHCSQRYITDPAPIEVLKNAKRKKIYVRYSLNYGNPPEVTETVQMQVPEGINFLDVMRLAQEINPKYRFMLDGNSEAPVVYSICDIPNDAEKGMFWILYLSSTNSRVQGDAGRLNPYTGNIKDLIPQTGDEIVFWMKSI